MKFKLNTINLLYAENLLKPFSVPGNLRRLLKKNDNTELSVINGMKFFAMCNIILGHRMLVMLGNAISNPDYNERVNLINDITHDCIIILKYKTFVFFYNFI